MTLEAIAQSLRIRKMGRIRTREEAHQLDPRAQGLRVQQGKWELPAGAPNAKEVPLMGVYQAAPLMDTADVSPAVAKLAERNIKNYLL